MLGWMYVITLVALLAAKGRDYYLAPAYPMLIAAGAVWGEQWVNSLSLRAAAEIRRATWITLLCATLCASALTLPIAPLNSRWWRVANSANGNFDMEVGWLDMAETVAKIRDSLPAEERAGIAILAGDEGEAGAINLYGPAYGLPEAISGMNSNWYRGYGDPPPQTVITLGLRRDVLDPNFKSCVLAGHVTNRNAIATSAVAGWGRNLRLTRASLALAGVLEALSILRVRHLQASYGWFLACDATRKLSQTASRRRFSEAPKAIGPP